MIVADGFEDIELVAIHDILKRAGSEVTLASATGNTLVKSMMGLSIQTESLIE